MEGGGPPGGDGGPGGGWGGGPGGGGGWGGRGGGQGGGGGQGESPAPTPRTTTRTRVTVDLPSSYVPGDSDGDNQLGLNEWTSWKTRSAMREFIALDVDGDGFLTPRELGGRPSSSSSGGTAAVTAPSTPAPGSPVPGGVGGAGGDTPPGSAAPSATPTVSLADFEFDADSPQRAERPMISALWTAMTMANSVPTTGHPAGAFARSSRPPRSTLPATWSKRNS